MSFECVDVRYEIFSDNQYHKMDFNDFLKYKTHAEKPWVFFDEKCCPSIPGTWGPGTTPTPAGPQIWIHQSLVRNGIVQSTSSYSKSSLLTYHLHTLSMPYKYFLSLLLREENVCTYSIHILIFIQVLPNYFWFMGGWTNAGVTPQIHSANGTGH